jgi:hypothetical protein
MHGKLFTLSIDIEPASTGENQLHMYANTLDGQEATIVEWHVAASNPDQGIEAIDADVLPLSASHAIASIGLPSSGTWTFRFDLRISETEEEEVFANIPVAK